MVLGVGLTPPAGAKQLAEQFGVELEPHGFCKTEPTNPIETTRPGIFVSGAFRGPMDIPEAVMTASGAGALRVSCSAPTGVGSWAKSGCTREERDVRRRRPGRGVRLPLRRQHRPGGERPLRWSSTPRPCPRRSRRGGPLHLLHRLRRRSRTPSGRRGSTAWWSPPAPPGRTSRCSATRCAKAGINQYFFDMANIREHCSWVHSKEKEEATQKAKDIVRMSVARAAHLEPLQEFDLPVNKTALVVGGGLAGMTSALSLAEQGFEVYLVEKESELGGMARRLHYTLDGLDVQAYLRELMRKVYRHPQIHVSPTPTITEVTGYVGNFVTTVQVRGPGPEIKHGATIIATGADEYRPTEYLYGQDDRVLTQLELEERIAGGDERLRGAQSLVMIQCVGCRQEDRNYCARICCSQADQERAEAQGAQPGAWTSTSSSATCGPTGSARTTTARRRTGTSGSFATSRRTSPRWRRSEEDGRQVLRVTVHRPDPGQEARHRRRCLALSVAVVPSPGSAGDRPPVQGVAEPGRLLPGSPRQAAAGRLRRRRRLPVRHGALSQAPLGDDQPGLRRRRPGADAAVAGHGHRLRLGVRGERERLRLLRRLHHGVHLRRHRVRTTRRAARRRRSTPCCARATGCATRSARPARSA